MRVSIVAAVARNGVIGRGGGLPWRLPDDLRRFKSITMGHTIVMGRRTYESIGRPLPGRITVVITRRDITAPEGVRVAGSLEEALSVAVGDEVFIVGGADVYRLALARADRLYLTHVEADVEGDVTFPDYDPSAWRLVEEQSHAADPEHAYPFRFAVYDRVSREGP